MEMGSINCDEMISSRDEMISPHGPP